MIARANPPIPLPAKPRILVVTLASSRRRAADDAADPQPAAGVARCDDRRAGVRRHRRHRRQAIRISIASSPWRRGRRWPKQLRSLRACSSATTSRFRPSPATARRSSPCLAGRTPCRPDRRRRASARPRAQAAPASSQRRRCAEHPPRRADAPPRRCARHRARAGAGLPGGGPRRRRYLARRKLRRDPCRADVSLQAMDRAKAGARWPPASSSAAFRLSRSAGRTKPSAAISTACGTARLPIHQLTWPENVALLVARARLRRARYVGDPPRRRFRLPDGGAVRAERSPRLGALAGRRPRCAVAGQRDDSKPRQRLDRAKSAAVPAVHLRGLRAAHRERQRLPGGARRRTGAGRRRSGAG